MLRVRRRHLKSCPRKSLTYRRCRCPVWVFGTRDGNRIRKSLDTTSWEQGEEFLRSLDPADPIEEITVGMACERYLADCEFRHLSLGTMRKYRHLIGKIKGTWGTRKVDSVKVEDVREFRESWKLKPTSASKRLEMVRGFFSFCVDSGWIERNPARGIKSPMIRQKPTLPFSEEDFEKIMWAVEVYCEKHPQSPELTQRKLRAIILLMRHTGIRISDAVMMKRERIRDGRLFLYQAKTGHPVRIPLPLSVLDALNECEDGGEFYFWPGGTLKTWTTEWQARLKKVFVIGGLPEGHAHQLRDSFAVDLLSKGVSLETVSMLLGHKDIRITQRHYNPWVRQRQDALEAAVVGSWK